MRDGLDGTILDIGYWISVVALECQSMVAMHFIN
jgi:hypothetical protein